jgi:IclR family pca regulon transcriptional regulator
MDARTHRSKTRLRHRAHSRPGEVDDFEQGRDYVRSLARGLTVLRSAGGSEPATLAQIAARAGLSRAAARRLVLTLEHLGYLRPAGRGYIPTPRVLELGYGYLGGQALPDVAQPWMEQLAHRVGESCSMAVLDEQHIIYVARVPVSKIMTVSLAVGARLPAYCTSMGRVLLSGLTPAALDTWLAACRPESLTPRTVTDKRRLRQIIEGVRREGFAWVERELETGLCSMAVPVHEPGGRLAAALNIGMPYQPEARTRALRELLPALRETAAGIERAWPRGAPLGVGP